MSHHAGFEPALPSIHGCPHCSAAVVVTWCPGGMVTRILVVLTLKSDYKVMATTGKKCTKHFNRVKEIILIALQP